MSHWPSCFTCTLSHDGSYLSYDGRGGDFVTKHDVVLGDEALLVDDTVAKKIYIPSLIHIYTVSGKTGTTSILGITLTKFNKFL